MVKCFAGCTAEAIVGSLGLKLSDLFPAKERSSTGLGRMVAIYDYQDATGTLLFQVCRFEPKTFRQRMPDTSSSDGWTWKLGNTQRVLFRLPEILKAVADERPIWICEGEKDCLALVENFLHSTCNVGGAGKWGPEYSESLRGADVSIVADKDVPGRAHAQKVGASLFKCAKSVRVIEVPDVNGKVCKDVSDYLVAGGCIGELIAIADEAPTWTPIVQVTDSLPGNEDSPTERTRTDPVDKVFILPSDHTAITESRAPDIGI